jgi:hypothetical protein
MKSQLTLKMDISHLKSMLNPHRDTNTERMQSWIGLEIQFGY